MAAIDKVDAFIKFAEAMDKGNHGRAIKMGKIIEKAIDKDMRENTYSSKINMRREEKKIFAVE